MNFFLQGQSNERDCKAVKLHATNVQQPQGKRTMKRRLSGFPEQTSMVIKGHTLPSKKVQWKRGLFIPTALS